MPNVTVNIGGRAFELGCNPGEEEQLRQAAATLDADASALVDHAGRLPETQLLLMSGLMLANRFSGLKDQLKAAEAELAEVKSRAPKVVEIPVVPASVSETLSEMAARAEALADLIEEKADQSK